MTLRALRLLVMVLGAVAAGAWASQPVSAMVMRALGPSADYNGTRDVLTVALVASAAHLFGAAVAGLVLGLVADGESTALWLVVFLAVWILWMSGPTLSNSHRASGSILWAFAAQGLIWLVAAAAFWIGVHLRGPRPLA